ncbi:YpsA SLOG family protein [Microbulbifer sp. THAF38]|uniref:YpsA SLOG family protein n=1 Tax=Microbulbifer sp. THAF38 TaxID=2587856 RepID=UPI001268132F|nr:putative molybdenum carrier protein [Microbulbifer sp. THAF38]QFT54539.1 Putative molybdenum carrier [Microbulbifer sp. THAF38]
MIFKPEKIISGGQTGADTGGLIAGQRLGIATGGAAPKGYLTEEGARAEFLKGFGLIELPTKDLAERTRENIRNSDATLIFTDNPNSDGTAYTIRFCREMDKPYLIVDPREDCCRKIRAFIDKNRPFVLNVAGNRESNSRGITQRAIKIIQQVFSG